jgi:chromosome segregation ATPase
MKRFLLAASLAALLPAAVLAQSAATPNAKADPKKSGASRPVEDKSRRLTRDELRACMLLSDANKAESIGVRDAQAAYFKERADLLAAKEKLKKQSDWLDEEGNALKAEQGEVLKAQDALKEQLPKLDKAAADAAIEAHKARAAKLDARIDALNAGMKQYNVDAKALNAKGDANNAVMRELNARTEAHLAKVEEWKAGCSNRSYDEMDEAVIRREMGKTQ